MTETFNAVSESALLIGLRASLLSLSEDVTTLVRRNEELERLGRELVDDARVIATTLTVVPRARVDALTVLLDQCLADRAAGR